MIRALHFLARTRILSSWLLVFFWADLAAAQVLLTNISELRNAVSRGKGGICTFTLEGVVLDCDNHSGTLFFQDDSGTEILRIHSKDPCLRPGQKIRLYGTNYVTYVGAVLSVGTQPVVDADLTHPPTERQGTVLLRAGRHPFKVKWFNWIESGRLNVAYSGPLLAKQTIPDDALWHTETAPDGGPGRVVQGMEYRCFEGEWEKLPDYDQLAPKRTGVASSFDINLRTRPDNAGLEFDGLLDVPEDGGYTFYLTSDDGGQLFFYPQPPGLKVIGTAPVPAPRKIIAGQSPPGDREPLWAEIEGNVNFLGRDGDEVELEVISGEHRMRVEVLDAAKELPWYLLHSRVRLRGICSDIRDTDGRHYGDSMMVAGWQNLRVLEVSTEQWSAFKSGTVGELSQTLAPSNTEIVHLHGHLRADGTVTRFEDETGSAPIDLLTEPPTEPDSAVECLCRWARYGTNVSLLTAVAHELSNSVEGTARPPRLLTTAMQVQQLKPEEAVREYPVEIHGVITWVSSDFAGFVIQDFTRAVYVVSGDQPLPILPRVGEYYDLKGITQPGDFSPIVRLRKAVLLGNGKMPPPINPTRDQLLNGSLDAQYVELRGMVTAKHDSYVTLLTSEGSFDLDIVPAPGEPWEKFLNAIIRVRGCFFANWNGATHQVVWDQPIFRIAAATVSVEVPPPVDLFQADEVRGPKLMYFDVRSDTLRRIKTSGQILYGSSDLYYLVDGVTGLRFRLAQPSVFAPGDEVDVAGLVELGGSSPILRQAVARKTGHSALPKARPITLDALSTSYDSTLVTVEGTLVDIQNRGAEQILEIQVGVRSFAARLKLPRAATIPWTIGSRLKLTGVFHDLDGNQVTSRIVNSFELLLNSPADVQVMARPPWWTLGRLLMIVAVLVVGLALAFIWIELLRGQVERRTVQLRSEMIERERAEKSRAIEQERSRIARDLHDDLGSKLTEISMLATTSPGLRIGPEVAAERLAEIAATSRAMTSALEGVVWVINSKNDTLSSLIEYLASVGEEFLAKAGIACRVELPADYADKTISAEMRHDVLLSVREAVNNAVRHGRPTEVLLRIALSANSLEIQIQDNGCGFEPVAARGHGLENMRQRMVRLKGSCEIETSRGGGTTVTLKLPLLEQARVFERSVPAPR